MVFRIHDASGSRYGILLTFLCFNNNIQLTYALKTNSAEALDKKSTRRIYTHTCTVNFLLVKQMNALLLVLSLGQITPQCSLKLTFSTQGVLREHNKRAWWPLSVREWQKHLETAAEICSRVAVHTQARASQTLPVLPWGRNGACTRWEVSLCPCSLLPREGVCLTLRAGGTRCKCDLQCCSLKACL